MGIFSNLFKKIIPLKKEEPKKCLNEEEIEQRNNEFAIKAKQESELFDRIFEMYNANSCQCAYPRFQQLIGIDCVGSGYTFKCFDTEFLINSSKPFFQIGKSDLIDENVNELWTCKKCGSTYEFGWQDFSIALDREKLKLIDLKADQIGKTAIKPFPLYLGLRGYSYPPRTEMANADFQEFEKYMMER